MYRKFWYLFSRYDSNDTVYRIDLSILRYRPEDPVYWPINSGIVCQVSSSTSPGRLWKAESTIRQDAREEIRTGRKGNQLQTKTKCLRTKRASTTPPSTTKQLGAILETTRKCMPQKVRLKPMENRNIHLHQTSCDTVKMLWCRSNARPSRFPSQSRISRQTRTLPLNFRGNGRVWLKFLKALESDWDAHSIYSWTSSACRTVSCRPISLYSIGLSRNTN
jgi:hypothetical protein